MNRSFLSLLFVASLPLAASPGWGQAPSAASVPPAIARPAGVSPGGAEAFLAAETCPAFSWTAVAEAQGYELRAYRLDRRQQLESAAALEAKLPAGASSWSPPADRCLAPGERYAWSVRALTERTSSPWSEALLFEVAAPEIDLAAALAALRQALASDPEALTRLLTRVREEAASGAAGGPAGRDETSPGSDIPTGGPPAIAVRGEVPDVAGETYGVRGVSNSPDGAGVRADNNNASGADLVLGGSPVAELTESAFSRDSAGNLNFNFTNPGTGTMTVQADGSNLVTAAAGSALWVDQAGDTMSGLLILDPAAGFALQTGSGDAINLQGNVFKDGLLFLHDTGTQNTALGHNALLANTTGFENTAVGYAAMLSNTTGPANTGLGSQALRQNLIGGANTAVGYRALRNNTNHGNTALGHSALYANTGGSENTALGNDALFLNTTGFHGTAVGSFALRNNTSGANNVAVGYRALDANASGNSNVAIGTVALAANTTASSNAAVGAFALDANTTGTLNVALGRDALGANTTANRNTAVGAYALDANTTGGYNVALGSAALGSNTTANNNTAVGLFALGSNTGGSYNVALGRDALGANTTGNRNIAIGRAAGQNFTTGSYNTAIGAYGVAGESNTIRIGWGPETRAFIDGIRGVTTGVANAIPVLIDSLGQLGTVSSSARFKEDIADLGEASARLLALRPVQFRYKPEVQAGERPLEYGLIAEEVAEVFPELVVYDEEGRPETVKYHVLSTLLLNELQRERERVAGEIAALRAELAALRRRGR